MNDLVVDDLRKPDLCLEFKPQPNGEVYIDVDQRDKAVVARVVIGADEAADIRRWLGEWLGVTAKQGRER